MAFREALAARRELAPPGATAREAPYVLTVTLLQLNAEQNADRQGAADMVVRLVDRSTGRVAYSARTYAESRGDNYLAYDNLLLGSPPALGGVARAVLGQAVDETVDRAGFRRAVAARSAEKPAVSARCGPGIRVASAFRTARAE